MKKAYVIILFSTVMWACGGGSGGGETASEEGSAPGKAAAPTSLAEAEANYKDYKGVGPVSSLELADAIDEAMATKGKEVFDMKCVACHKTEEKFIGPAPKGILDRRTPEWVMNMVLNPEEMVQKDPIAKFLLIEYNLAPMANQSLTEEEARAVLEYFRTL